MFAVDNCGKGCGSHIIKRVQSLKLKAMCNVQVWRVDGQARTRKKKQKKKKVDQKEDEALQGYPTRHGQEKRKRDKKNKRTNGKKKKQEKRRKMKRRRKKKDETLTLDVRDAVTPCHCKTQPLYTLCTPHPVTAQPARQYLPHKFTPHSLTHYDAFLSGHDHLEAVVLRIPGEQRVHRSLGFLQVEDLIVTTVVLAARQGQRRRGRVLEMVADDSQTLIQVLFDPGIGFRNLDAACTAFGERSFSVQICSKLEYNYAKVSIRRMLVQVVDLVIRLFVRLVRLSQAALLPVQFVPNAPQVVRSYVEVHLLHFRFLTHTTFSPFDSFTRTKSTKSKPRTSIESRQ